MEKKLEKICYDHGNRALTNVVAITQLHLTYVRTDFKQIMT